jgi:hypothetical protein
MRFFARAGSPAIFQAPVAAGEALPIESGEEAWLRDRFSLTQTDTAAAAAGRMAGATPGALILRPVHLHAGLDHLVLDPPAHLGLSKEHAKALFNAAADWLAPEPIALRFLSPDLWEVTEPHPERTGFGMLRGASSARASGRNIDLWLPRGPSARDWRRLMNEVQMLWQTHPVNAEREAAGLKPVNALWLEGVVPGELPPAFDLVASADPVLVGLAHASGATRLPSLIDTAPTSVAHDQTALLDAPFWREAVASGSDQAWEDGWYRFEQWFLSTTDQLGAKGWQGAVLVLTGEFSAHTLALPRLPAWRIWRRTAPASWFVESAPPA